MKKYNKIAIFVMLAGMIGVTPACKDYFDLNDNPNQVQDPSIQAMLSTATHKAAINTYSFANVNSYYAQYLASPSAGGATDTYQITNTSSQWNSAYYAMADLSDMIKKAEETGATEHLGVGQLLLAYNLGLVADTWGSAPYSEAFGVDGILNPKFDSEESLYQESLRLINESITNLQKTATIPLNSTSDLIHGGDKNAWIKTAYGIKARFLNKISKKAAYDPAAVLSALDNSYSSLADEGGMDVFTGINPWAQIAVSNAGNLLGGWLSKNFMDHLNGTKYGIVDPRIAKITDKTVNDDYTGTRNGEGNKPGTGANTIHNETYISVNSPLTTQTSPLYILTYPEIKFIEAEAAFRSGPAGRARAYAAYLEGIRASMNKLQVPEGQRNAYLANAAVGVGAANLTLALIFKEKYTVMYLSPESWNDLRRNDYQYKDFEMPLNAVLPEFIRRVSYPNDELSENGSNVPAEVPLDTELWWDKP